LEGLRVARAYDADGERKKEKANSNRRVLLGQTNKAGISIKQSLTGQASSDRLGPEKLSGNKHQAVADRTSKFR
jgi:hypothetical protein